MKLSQFNFKLPQELIALYPNSVYHEIKNEKGEKEMSRLTRRDECRLMVLHKKSGTIDLFRKDKKGKPYLFFSNPNDAKNRINMTIKVSDDEGNSWDKLPSVLLYEQAAMGYSCLTVIDNKYIGIFYEGDGDLYFQKIPIKEFIK